MITQNELSSLNLSPTKKDFVQIWNELIEVASKITERWDPTSTNESDPGIVLLKVLAGIADKLNYNIDKNILEAYMPTAAQMESMRKLCELVGYDIKYYQSAETMVRISYTGNTAGTDDNEEKLPDSGLAIPKFTTITNADKDITFVTVNALDALITNDSPWVEVPCIEGQISQCESTNENNLITLSQLDDNNRYYLPEIQIAENGIFVYNAATALDKNNVPVLIDGAAWQQVSNLNTQSLETRVFKFGYDSFEGRPYLAFPSDIGSLIGDGLFIYFIRTSGLSGNISPRTLEILEIPTEQSWEGYSAEQFEVVNADATTNGANIESISGAYNNFKKTVGTFDTLVTCRDYMNKIYSLMDASNSPYVSNILVTDIRNDINNAITLCSCNEYGILYKEIPLTRTDKVISTTTTTTIDVDDNGQLIISTDTPVEVETDIPLIDHFDLLLYPFKTFTQVSAGTKDLVAPYNKSFMYTEQMNREIEASLADLKTCAHNFVTPVDGDIVAINNYLRLNALIATSTKVSEIEANSILQNVKVALVNEFNLRNLDFGEEIPFDSILSVIENADSRIKVVSLQEPTLLTTYSVKEQIGSVAASKEYAIASGNDKIKGVNYTYIDESTEEEKDYTTAKNETAKDIYNKLVLRNILAGRASLFDYDETFIPNNSEKSCSYTVTEKLTSHTIDLSGYTTAGEYTLTEKGPHNGVLTLKVFAVEDATTTPDAQPDSITPATSSFVKEVYETYAPYENAIISGIKRVEAVCEIQSDTAEFKNVKLDKNEVIKFRAPNLITTKTFPAYVYYHFERAAKNAPSQADDAADGKADGLAEGRYAECMSLNSFIQNVAKEEFFIMLWSLAGSNIKTFTATEADGKLVINTPGEPANTFNTSIAIKTTTQLNPANTGYTMDDSSTVYIYANEGTLSNDLAKYFTDEANKGKTVTFSSYPLNQGTMNTWIDCVKSFKADLPGDTILWRLSSTSGHPKGKLVTEAGQRLYAQSGEYLINSRVGDTTYICTDLGQNPEYYLMSENSDIELRSGDKLYIHYTPSSTNEDGETVNAEPVSIVYEGGGDEPVIIKPSGFTLMPSDAVNRQGTSWKKTEVDFGKHGKKNLLALAPNEQIEMRSISKVVINTAARFYKNFDNVELEHGNINEVINYELKDGEYLFYTDQNTQEAAYYGSGSVITLDKGAFIPKTSEPVEVSQILEQGLHIVPWSDYVLLNKDKKVTITEYQYVTLVEGDTLNTLSIGATDAAGRYLISSAREVMDDNKRVREPWVKCLSTDENTGDDKPIIYTPAGSDTSITLPKVDLQSGPSTSWEVCSFLELSTSPGYAQRLRMTDKSASAIAIKDKINVYTDPSSTPVIVTPFSSSEPLSFKLSTIVQSASGTFEKVDPDLEDDVDDSTMQMKIFEEEAPAFIALSSLDEVITQESSNSASPVDAGSISLNNNWTRVEIDSQLSKSGSNPAALSLNFMVPPQADADIFGIVSIYLAVPGDRLASGDTLKTKSRVFIDIPAEFGTGQEVISIFNYQNKDEDGNIITYHNWWPDRIDTSKPNRLYLRAGLNCIKINKSCSFLIKAEAEAVGSLLYDNLRLVKGRATHGINLALLDPDVGYTQATNEDKINMANKVLVSINALDKKHDFYYSVPVENSLAIEFDKNINSFSNPHTLYDINNINNAFVISKLDVKYLDDGLKIAKSSKY